jgi:hypothetical protein
MTDPEEICSFISGEERKTVIDAAHKRITQMMDKAGDTGPVTETKADFEEGFQKMKDYITCEDVLKNLRVKENIYLPLNLSLLKFNEEKT